jgi:hypothetical protein
MAEPPSASSTARSRKWLWIPAVAALVLAAFFLKRLAPGDKAAPLVAELRDGGVTIGLDAEGMLHAPDRFSAPDKVLLADALKSKSLPLAALPSDLVVPPGTWSASAASDDFGPISPMFAILYTDRPEFRWRPLEGAVTYEVHLFDAEFHEVDSSGTTREKHWTPVAPLSRGALYQWQIVANRKEGPVRVPASPAADAKFRILDVATFARVEAARAEPAPSHLLAAILLAKAGIKDEVQKELDALASENPGSELVSKLGASLQN